MFVPWTVSPMRAYQYVVRDTQNVIILSVVAFVLVLGIGICITINPLAAIGLAPILQPLPRSSAPSADTPPTRPTATDVYTTHQRQCERTPGAASEISFI